MVAEHVNVIGGNRDNACGDQGEEVEVAHRVFLHSRRSRWANGWWKASSAWSCGTLKLIVSSIAEWRRSMLVLLSCLSQKSVISRLPLTRLASSWRVAPVFVVVLIAVPFW